MAAPLSPPAGGPTDRPVSDEEPKTWRERMKQTASVAANGKRTLGLVWRVSPGLLSTMIVCALLDALTLVTMAWVGKEIVDSIYEKDHVTVSIGKGKDGKEQIQVGANLQAVLKDLEAQMREAATNLEFEKAARLRDEIRRLREMELDTLEGEVS